MKSGEERVGGCGRTPSARLLGCWERTLSASAVGYCTHERVCWHCVENQPLGGLRLKPLQLSASAFFTRAR